MKIFAHYDSTGTIRSLITVNAPEGAIVMLTPKPGQFLTQLEGLNLEGLNLGSDAPDLKALREITKNHKIATPIPHCSLVKKR